MRKGQGAQGKYNKTLGSWIEKERADEQKRRRRKNRKKKEKEINTHARDIIIPYLRKGK